MLLLPVGIRQLFISLPYHCTRQYAFAFLSPGWDMQESETSNVDDEMYEDESDMSSDVDDPGSELEDEHSEIAANDAHLTHDHVEVRS